jgi:lipoprotein-anchoring transpeptidase ErfK/SrfK
MKFSVPRSIATFTIAMVMANSVGMISPKVAQSITWQQQIQNRMVELKKSPDRWIEINLTTQRLFAWEGNKNVYAVIVSTGKKTTPTNPGLFKIKEKRPIDRMRGEGYDVANVPHAMYYYGGYAIHGAYWHNNFGTPVSHGCTNVAPDHAEWLFDWADVGTPIVIHY